MFTSSSWHTAALVEYFEYCMQGDDAVLNKVKVKYCQIRCVAPRVLKTSKGFWVFLFRHVNHLSGCGVTQITTQRAHQFRALARRERKSFNRKSKEVVD